jgi:hypothetical protein
MNTAISKVTSSKPKTRPNLSFLFGSDGESSGGIGNLNLFFAFNICLITICSICFPYKALSALMGIGTR